LEAVWLSFADSKGNTRCRTFPGLSNLRLQIFLLYILLFSLQLLIQKDRGTGPEDVLASYPLIVKRALC
jgi:hypothetical protein